MRLKRTRVVSLLIPLVLCFLLVGLLAGCGAGSNQSGSGGQAKKQAGKAQGKPAKKKPLPRAVAIGTIRAYKSDRRRISLRPASSAQSKKPIGIKVRKNAQIALDGKKAGLSDIKADQQAQITYVVKNNVKRAVVVHLFTKQPSKGGGKTKQPSKGGGKTG